MTTRYAVKEDVDEIVRVINLAYRVEDFFVRGNRTAQDDIEQRMTDGAVIVIDSDEPGMLAGAVCVDCHGDRGHFAMLSVDPRFQGQGLGRELVTAAERHCLAEGCTFLDMEIVNLREELPAFYSRLGFMPSGTAAFTNTAKLTREAHLVVMSKRLT